MIGKTLKKLSLMPAFGVLISMSACAGGKVVDCKHQMIKDISQQVEMGSKRVLVESYLRTIGANYSYHDKNELLATRDKDADQFDAKIIVMVNMPSEVNQLVTSSELMTIGFDESDLVQAVSCEKIYTGP